MSSSMLPNDGQSCPLKNVMVTEIANSLKLGNPPCKCALKIADGTCKSYKLLIRLKNCFDLYGRMRWKLMFRSRRYRLMVLQELISDCLYSSSPLN
jgi:hypothetical protein